MLFNEIAEETLRPAHRMPNRLIRIFALATAAMVMTVGLTSAVGVSVWFVDGFLANCVASAYVVSLLFLALKPYHETGHKIAFAAGALFWVGRGAAFLELVLSGRRDLLGAVAERWWAVVAIITVHAMFLSLSSTLHHLKDCRAENMRLHAQLPRMSDVPASD